MTTGKADYLSNKNINSHMTTKEDETGNYITLGGVIDSDFEVRIGVTVTFAEGAIFEGKHIGNITISNTGENSFASPNKTLKEYKNEILEKISQNNQVNMTKNEEDEAGNYITLGGIINSDFEVRTGVTVTLKEDAAIIFVKENMFEKYSNIGDVSIFNEMFGTKKIDELYDEFIKSLNETIATRGLDQERTIKITLGGIIDENYEVPANSEISFIEGAKIGEFDVGETSIHNKQSNPKKIIFEIKESLEKISASNGQKETEYFEKTCGLNNNNSNSNSKYNDSDTEIIYDNSRTSGILKTKTLKLKDSSSNSKSITKTTFSIPEDPKKEGEPENFYKNKVEHKLGTQIIAISNKNLSSHNYEMKDNNDVTHSGDCCFETSCCNIL